MFGPLMKDCITQEDKDALVNFIQTSNRYTKRTYVVEFEKEWSEWLDETFSICIIR